MENKEIQSKEDFEKELEAMSAIVEALEKHTKKERRRIINWLYDRFVLNAR